MLTTDQIESKFESLDTKIKGIVSTIERMSADLSNKTNNANLNRSISELKELIRQNAIAIQDLNNKLSMVILPEQTRMYLDGGEVQSFQSNFNTLKAMMVKFDKLYNNLVAFQSNSNT